MFKRTITTRWLISSILTMALVFIIINILGGYAFSNYFYTSVRQQLTTEADKIQTSLQYYSFDKNSNLSAQIRTMVESFENKEKYELMMLNEDGETVLSSSGFEATITDNMTVIRKGKKKYFIIEHKY